MYMCVFSEWRTIFTFYVYIYILIHICICVYFLSGAQSLSVARICASAGAGGIGPHAFRELPATLDSLTSIVCEIASILRSHGLTCHFGLSLSDKQSQNARPPPFAVEGDCLFWWR